MLRKDMRLTNSWPLLAKISKEYKQIEILAAGVYFVEHRQFFYIISINKGNWMDKENGFG